jgi:DNA (cytosine-5)-methyltransferase 1
LKHASLFSGIGGFDLAAEEAGFENIFSCEIDEFCNKVLEKNFPHVKRYKSITRIDFTQYRHRLDVISGGFPCQPFSIAGKRQGKNDERHLWPEMLRVIKEARPTWIVGENVANYVNMELEQAISDLEGEGYEVQPFVIPALAVGAEHLRNRVWIISYSGKCRLERFSWGAGKKPQNGYLQSQAESSTYSHGYADGLFRREIQSKTAEAKGEEQGAHGERLRSKSGSIPNTGYTAGTGLSFTQAGQHFEPALEVKRTGLQYGTADTHDGRQALSQQQTTGDKQYSGFNTHTQGEGLERYVRAGDSWSGRRSAEYAEFGNWVEAATSLCGMDDALPVELDGFKLTKAKHREKRLHALGNAIVPGIAKVIFSFIREIEENLNKGLN